MTLQVLSWISIVILSVSYWFQIYKIHIHKEVRDISLTYYVLLGVGFGVLSFTAYEEKSLIFLVKQIATTIPVIIIIIQVLYHRNDSYHDSNFKICKKCSREKEPLWNCCPFCGTDDDSNSAPKT